MHQKTRNSSEVVNVVNLKHMVAKTRSENPLGYFVLAEKNGERAKLVRMRPEVIIVYFSIMHRKGWFRGIWEGPCCLNGSAECQSAANSAARRSFNVRDPCTKDTVARNVKIFVFIIGTPPQMKYQIGKFDITGQISLLKIFWVSNYEL